MCVCMCVCMFVCIYVDGWMDFLIKVTFTVYLSLFCFFSFFFSFLQYTCLHLTILPSFKLSLPFSFFFSPPIMNNELVLLWSSLLGISAACVRACLMDCCMLIWLEDDGQFSAGVTGEIKEPFVRVWAMCLWQTGTDLESLPLYLCTSTGERRTMGNTRLCHYWFREGCVSWCPRPP